MSEILDVIRTIRRNGMLTGSKKFGVDGLDSDWDYILSYEFFQKERLFDYVGRVFKYEGDSGRDDEGSFNNYKIFYNDKVYDIIIPYNEIHFLAWEQATKWMSEFPKDLIADKSDRISLFENLKRISREHSEKRRQKEIDLQEDVPF